MYEACLCLIQHKLFDHDNMKYLKKLLDELENVMDQVETELQRRVEETPGTAAKERTLEICLGDTEPHRAVQVKRCDGLL